MILTITSMIITSRFRDLLCILSTYPTGSINCFYAALCQNQVSMHDVLWCQLCQNIIVWSRKRFIAEPSKENGWFMLKRSEIADGFQGRVFKGKIWGEGCTVYNFFLIGWWWGNTMITQDSCAHLKLPSSTWVGALFPVKELKNILLLYPLKRN